MGLYHLSHLNFYKKINIYNGISVEKTEIEIERKYISFAQCRS